MYVPSAVQELTADPIGGSQNNPRLAPQIIQAEQPTFQIADTLEHRRLPDVIVGRTDRRRCRRRLAAVSAIRARWSSQARRAEGIHACDKRRKEFFCYGWHP